MQPLTRKMQNSPEDLSIVTTVYNHKDTVADALDSILMQKTNMRYHVYCLNDASTDDSAIILAEYQARYPDKITVLTSDQNQGTGKKTILYNRPPVRGRYWTLLAGDDYWITEDKIEQQIRILDANPTATGCASHTVMRDETNGKETIIRPSQQRWNLMDLILKRHTLYVHPSSIIWRNIFRHDDFFLPPGFIQSERTGDTLLAHMALSEGGHLINYPQVTSCYRLTGRGVWSKLTQEERYAQNRDLARHIAEAVPLRYRIALKLDRSKRLRKLSGLFAKPLNQ